MLGAFWTSQIATQSDLDVLLAFFFFVHSGSACFSVGIRSVLKMFAKKSAGKNRGCRESGQRWAEASPHKAGLALLQVSNTLHLTDMMVRKAIKAGPTDDWSELTRREELNVWMMAELKGSHYRTRQEDDQRQSVVRRVLVRVLSLQDGTDASEAKVFLVDVQPKCRSICKLVETTWWDDFSGACRSKVGSTARMG